MFSHGLHVVNMLQKFLIENCMDCLVTQSGPRPVINEPPPLNREYHRDPNVKARKKEGVY